MRCESWSEKWLTGIFVWGATGATIPSEPIRLKLRPISCGLQLGEIDASIDAIAGDYQHSNVDDVRFP
jgi:hypothetical protein